MFLIIIIAVLAGGLAIGATKGTSMGQAKKSVHPLVVAALRNVGIYDSQVWFKHDDLFAKWGNFYGVPAKWMKAMSGVESNFGENTRVKSGEVSYDGLSYGLMQVTMRTGQSIYERIVPRGILTPSLLNNDNISVQLAALYLSDLSKQFPGNERNIILSYNQGPGNTLKGKDSGYYDKVREWLDLIEATV